MQTQNCNRPKCILDYNSHRMHQFISTDPIINKKEALSNPQLWNLYSYCRNNPITFWDPDGRKVGDKYKTMDKAAGDALNEINPKSVKQHKEYAGMLYKNKDGTFSYTKPNRGTKDGSSPGGPKSVPKKTTAVAYYHTHGGTDPGYANEKFSKADKKYAHKHKIAAYLATPKGKGKKYTKKTGVTSIGKIKIK